jgi:O-antigen ligase
MLAIVAGILLATQPMPLAATVGIVFVLLLLIPFTPLVACITMLLLAPLRTLIATESALQLPLDIGQITLLSFIGSYVVFRIARRQPLFSSPTSPVFFPVLFFLAATIPSAFTAQSLGAWITEWAKWIQILLLMFLVVHIAKASLWQWLVFGLTLSGVANSLVGLYEFLGGSGAEHLLINDRFFRAFGTFGQPNPFGGFMGLLAPLSLMATFGYVSRIWHIWRSKHQISGTMLIVLAYYAIASTLIVMGLFISWSRGAWLGFMLSTGVMLFALPRKIWQSLFVVTLLVGIVGTFWFSGRLPASIITRITSATEEFFAFKDIRGVDITPENYPVVERLAHWQAALNMIQAQPWLGIGFGNYEVVYPMYRLINWHFPLGHAHNYYLNIWAEAGIIGLVGYGSLWLGMSWCTWRLRKHPNPLARSVGIGLLGTWAYLAVHSIFDNLYVNNLFLHLGVMFGIVALLYNQTWKPLIWGEN